MSVSGRVSWPPEAPVWTFLWELVDGDTEAIAFRDVYFLGRKVFHKASLPMIRVRYDSGAGPYKDQLSIGNMQGPVKVFEHNQSGFRHLVVESYHTIGRYHLVNRWFFRYDGLILPQLHSAGLQHPSTHQHHVYWRFDFDVGGASNNLALEYTPGDSTNWGYGIGWRPITGEEAFWFSNKRWAVINKQFPNVGYFINRGEFDGQADSFSQIEGAAVLYRGTEDLRGRLGSPIDDGIYQHVTGENIDGKDVVFWYVAHLNHHYHGPEFEWHVCGPLLWPHRY
ncbi:hypothetical protein AB0K05_38190 [Nonomuraea sp. NPDC049486]|uniref:hypothetical protein n=1 Tax=Nonomuraea sp. NPDC049486 TaxID=3155773 RepID=UPI0034409B98